MSDRFALILLYLAGIKAPEDFMGRNLLSMSKRRLL